MIKILEKRDLAPSIESMVLAAPRIAAKAEPGQFIVLIVDEKNERIPLTIADFDRQKGTITIVYQVIGQATKALSSLSEGDVIYSILGPQGNPSEFNDRGTYIVVGGGVGVAPIYPVARKMNEHGCHVISIVGYRGEDYLFWNDRLDAVSQEFYITSNDGTCGRQGFVTDQLKDILDEKAAQIDGIFAVGPAPMMKAVSAMAAQYNVKTTVSLNAMMVCGMGMCGACRVTVNGETKFTCMDGADFDAQQVDFDELSSRLKMYKKEELEK